MALEQNKTAVKLIAKVQRGDRLAFSRFYDLYAPLAFSFALRILRVRSDAEDVVQDVFVYIWYHATSYDASRGTPTAWVSNLVKSRSIDRLRSLRRRDKGLESAGVAYALAEDEAAGRASFSSEARFLATGAMVKLPEEQKKAIEMVYFDGLTQEEIAERLGEPLGTIKSRIRAGLAKLREMVAVEQRKPA